MLIANKILLISVLKLSEPSSKVINFISFWFSCSQNLQADGVSDPCVEVTNTSITIRYTAFTSKWASEADNTNLDWLTVSSNSQGPTRITVANRVVNKFISNGTDCWFYDQNYETDAASSVGDDIFNSEPDNVTGFIRWVGNSSITADVNFFAHEEFAHVLSQCNRLNELVEGKRRTRETNDSNIVVQVVWVVIWMLNPSARRCGDALLIWFIVSSVNGTKDEQKACSGGIRTVSSS